jgi:hypothetical protein
MVFNRILNPLGSMLQRAIFPLALMTAIPAGGCKTGPDEGERLDERVTKATQELRQRSDKDTEAFLRRVNESLSARLGRRFYDGNDVYYCPQLEYEEILVKHGISEPVIRARGFCREEMKRMQQTLQKYIDEGRLEYPRIFFDEGQLVFIVDFADPKEENPDAGVK